MIRPGLVPCQPQAAEDLSIRMLEWAPQAIACREFLPIRFEVGRTIGFCDLANVMARGCHAQIANQSFDPLEKRRRTVYDGNTRYRSHFVLG